MSEPGADHPPAGGGRAGSGDVADKIGPHAHAEDHAADALRYGLCAEARTGPGDRQRAAELGLRNPVTAYSLISLIVVVILILVVLRVVGLI